MSKKYALQIDKDEMQEFGEYLRSARKSIGLTIKQMSELMGDLHWQTLYRWEKGRYIPKRDIYEIKMKISSIVKLKLNHP